MPATTVVGGSGWPSSPTACRAPSSPSSRVRPASATGSSITTTTTSTGRENRVITRGRAGHQLRRLHPAGPETVPAPGDRRPLHADRGIDPQRGPPPDVRQRHAGMPARGGRRHRALADGRHRQALGSHRDLQLGLLDQVVEQHVAAVAQGDEAGRRALHDQVRPRAVGHDVAGRVGHRQHDELACAQRRVGGRARRAGGQDRPAAEGTGEAVDAIASGPSALGHRRRDRAGHPGDGGLATRHDGLVSSTGPRRRR